MLSKWNDLRVFTQTEQQLAGKAITLERYFPDVEIKEIKREKRV